MFAFTPHQMVTERYLQNRLASYPKTLQKKINRVRGDSDFLEIAELFAKVDADEKESNKSRDANF